MFYPGSGREDDENYVALTNFRYKKPNPRSSLSCFTDCMVLPTFVAMWAPWSATSRTAVLKGGF